MNLRNVQNSSWRTTGQLFRETEKLISGQTETTGINLIDTQDLRWLSTSLLHCRAHQYATVKVDVFSDSLLCLGKMGDNPVDSWKKQVQWYSDNNYFSELNRIDGTPMEFEWKIFPGFTTAAILEEILKRWANHSVIQRISKTLNGKQGQMKNDAKIICKVLENTLDNFFAVGHGNELRSIVRNGLIPWIQH